MTPATLNPPVREPALDAVRGLAILAVTVFRFGTRHREETEAGEWLVWLCGKGERGVDLFFVLSGFLITGILFDARGRCHAFRNFMARRALRIFPLYFGVLLVSLILVPVFFPSQTFVNRYTLEHQAWLWAYGTNILVTLERGWPLGVFNHFWSLAVEEHFYLLWPLLILRLSRVASMSLCVFLVGAALGARLGIGIMRGNHIAAEALTVCRMDALAIGGWMALAARSPGGMRSLAPWAWRIGLPAFLAVLAVSVFRKGGFYVPHTLTALACAGLIVWALRGGDPVSRWLWRHPFLRTLGKYSYAMYVFQNLLVPLTEICWPLATLAETAGPVGGRLAYVGVSLGATLAAAFASWHLYEKHFLRLKRFFVDPPVTLETSRPPDETRPS